MVKTCIIQDCGKPRRGHGYCSAHYERWRRYGDPTFGRSEEGAALKFFRESVLPYTGDDCLLWPYAKTSGYGYMQFVGKPQRINRLICEHLFGPPPTPLHQAAHLCGKGHEGCCSPRHLAWKTRSENEADKLLHNTSARGERCGSSKLREEDAREIIALRGKVTQTELAKRYGVDQSHISRIQTGDVWFWL
jgi:hypothetical protein